jgi:hypothetical protein
MSTLKTLPNDASVEDFIAAIPDETKRQDSFKLLEMFTRLTGQEPRMWGTSIIGFGMYHYKSERSRQEGDWPLAGFSPRKQSLTLYLSFSFKECPELLRKLGKHKTSVACLYINKLADVDLDILEKLIARGYLEAKRMHGETK